MSINRWCFKIQWQECRIVQYWPCTRRYTMESVYSVIWPTVYVVEEWCLKCVTLFHVNWLQHCNRSIDSPQSFGPRFAVTQASNQTPQTLTIWRHAPNVPASRLLLSDPWRVRHGDSVTVVKSTVELFQRDASLAFLFPFPLSWAKLSVTKMNVWDNRPPPKICH